MCLYEFKILNPKYLPSEKNGCNPPAIEDYRKQYISVGCGWCKECRRQIANEWRIRLQEEYKSNSNAEFVTLSFSPQAIEKLEREIHEKKYKEIEGEDTDVNLLCSYAIRMYQERWRKKYGQAQRHWFITELGHENSKRIHLHGIVWNTGKIKRKTINKERSKIQIDVPKEEFRKDIIEKWSYGNVYIGQFVNEKTINYITKYITKLDTENLGYKQKIFTSKGIGRNYTEHNHFNIYRGESTNTYYRSKNGYKLGLPNYFKYKIWNENERSEIWTRKLDENKLTIDKIEIEATEENKETIKQTIKTTRERNELVGFGNHLTHNMKYIITEEMKMNVQELRDRKKKKTTTCKPRRETLRIMKPHETFTDKSMMIEKPIPGQYIGTTTAAERKKNSEIEEANKMKMSLKMYRLMKKGLL